MATGTAYGTNYALKNTPLVGTYPYAARCNSEVYCLSEEVYATASAGDAGSLLYVGKLPPGAIVLFSLVWPIDSDEIADGAAAMTNAVTGEIGISGDADLFGDITALNVAALQKVAPCPDGTTYTTTLDFALRSETNVIITTGGAALADTEGIALKMFYTMAGQTY